MSKMKKKLNWLKNAILNRKEYRSLSWWENFMSGHVSFGPVTIFGENAMHWAVNIKTKRWGYICFRLPLRCSRMRVGEFAELLELIQAFGTERGVKWSDEARLALEWKARWGDRAA